MPKIVEYTAGNTKLTPEARGSNAWQTTGRHIQGMYDSIATSKRQEAKAKLWPFDIADLYLKEKKASSSEGGGFNLGGGGGKGRGSGGHGQVSRGAGALGDALADGGEIFGPPTKELSQELARYNNKAKWDKELDAYNKSTLADAQSAADAVSKTQDYWTRYYGADTSGIGTNPYTGERGQFGSRPVPPPPIPAAEDTSGGWFEGLRNWFSPGTSETVSTETSSYTGE